MRTISSRAGQLFKFLNENMEFLEVWHFAAFVLNKRISGEQHRTIHELSTDTIQSIWMNGLWGTTKSLRIQIKFYIKIIELGLWKSE